MYSHGGRGMGIRKNAIMQGHFGKRRNKEQEIYSTTGSNFTNLEKGPVPHLHTDPVQIFISYCELQRGKPRNAQVTKRVWLQNQLKILRAHDPHLLILPYDSDSKANGINHPGHVPQTMDHLSVYFPRMYMQSGHITAKCRIQSSIPINQLKWKVMPQLEECNYFIHPTQLKALRTGKAGWLLGAHPDLTFRDGFQDTLPKLIKERYGKDMEFSVAPEKEVIVVGSKRVEQRVLVIRCALDEVENIRAFFTEVFSAQSELDMGYLTRYTFITTHPVGECTKSHLQKILIAQKQFHKNVHYFIMYGINNLDTFYPTISLPDSNSKSTENMTNVSDKANHHDDAFKTTSTTSNHPNESAQDTKEDENNAMDTDEVSLLSQEQEQDHSSEQSDTKDDNNSKDDVSKNVKENSAEAEPAQKNPPMSLRMLMYLCLSQDQDNLFHAVYPTTEKGKIYVLCTQDHRDEALTQLHHLEEAAQCYFPDEVLQDIFVGHKGMRPYVKDYPKISQHYQNYASVLVNMVGHDENPQGGLDDDRDPTVIPQLNQKVSTNFKAPSYAAAASSSMPSMQASSPSKRHRDGAFITPNKSSRLPQGFESSIKVNDQLNATVTESIARMRNLEKSHKNHDIKIDGITTTVDSYGRDMQAMGEDISTMGKALTSHSSSIKTLLEAQAAQQLTIEKIDGTLSKTQSNVSEIMEFNKKYLLPVFAKAPNGDGEHQS